MSNPLSMFRKHQYIFLVVFGVMLMVAFIVLPPLDDYLRTQRGPGSGGNPVVVRWNGGQLSESELDRLRLKHRVAVSYLYALVDETINRQGSPRGVRTGDNGQIVDPGIPSTMSDENLVHTQLLARRGEAMGLVVSDEAIAEFLEQLSDETITANEMGRILKDRLGGQYTTQQLLDQLRIELMAQRVRGMAEAGLYVAPFGTVQPIQAWDYFKRLNRRAKIEAVALNVEDYIDRVKEPTDAELKVLFEEGKSRFPFPESPEPGFHQRRKAAFQFVRADLGKYIEEEKAKVTVTDEEIEKHYEENKAFRYRVIDLPEEPAEGEAEAGEEANKPADATSKDNEDAAPVPPGDDAAPAPPADKPGDEKPKPPTAGDATTTEPEAPAPKPEEAKPEEAKPEEAKPEEAKPEEAKPEEPKTPESKTDEAESATDAPAPSGEANQDRAPREFFVSTQAEPNQPPASDPPADDPPAATTEPAAQPKTADPQSTPPAAAADESAQDKPADPKPTDPKPTDPKPTDPKPTDPKPTDPAAAQTPAAVKPAAEPAPASPAEQAAPDKPAATPPANAVDPADPAAETAPAEPEPPKLRPLDDELRQEIREELTESKARQPAQLRLDDALTELRNRVTKLGRAKRAEARAANPGVLEVEVSGPLGIDELAGKHGLTVGQIPLVDELQVAEYELGGAYNFPATMSWPITPVRFTDVAFQENVRRFSPTEIRGAETDIRFMYWKTDGEEPYVPDFKEARDDVLVAWKKIEARKIAEAEAQNLRDELAASKQTFAEKFTGSDHEVIAPPEFSWMTTGFNPTGAGLPTLNQVDGIENVSADFMKAVFSLKVGEVGAATNMPKDKVFVFRVDSESPSQDVLQQLFLVNGNSREVQYIAYVESISLLREWYSNLETEMGVKWLREPVNAT